MLAAPGRRGILRRGEATMMPVHVLDRELGVERDGKQPTPGDHCAAVGRTVGELVPDVRSQCRKRDARRQDGAQPMPRRRSFTLREQVDAEIGLHPGTEAEQVAGAGHPCHGDAQHEQCRQREVQQRVQQSRMPVAGLREIVPEQLVAENHHGVDHDEAEPHPRAAEQDAGHGGEGEQVDAHESQVLGHRLAPGLLDRLEHLF